MKWFKYVKADIMEMGINEEELRNGEDFREEVETFNSFQEMIKKKKCVTSTEERREQHKERMGDDMGRRKWEAIWEGNKQERKEEGNRESYIRWSLAGQNREEEEYADV